MKLGKVHTGPVGTFATRETFTLTVKEFYHHKNFLNTERGLDIAQSSNNTNLAVTSDYFFYAKHTREMCMAYYTNISMRQTE